MTISSTCYLQALLRQMCCAGLFAALLIVGACSGTSVPGVGGQGTGSSGGEQLGGISGLGSVVVEGTTYAEATDTVRQLELDPGSPVNVTASAVKLGMQTRVGFDAQSVIGTVRVLPTVLGLVERRDADALIVAGQTIRTMATVPAVFEGLSGFAEIVVGDRLEVHGYVDANNQIVATRIERLDPGSAAQTRVSGIATAVLNNGSRVQVGDLAIDISSATRILPSGTTLAAGQRIAVFAASNPAAGRLAATAIAVDAALSGSNLLRTGGVVRAFDRTTQRFRIGTIQIDASGSVIYNNGSASDLADGRVLRVRGQVSNGLLRAGEIQFLRAAEDSVGELTGVITDLVSSASFKVRGSAVDAGAGGVTFRGGTDANLANGALVRIEGRVIDGILRASRVEFVTAEDSRALAFRGLVSDYSAGSGSFVLLGVPMRLDGNARLAATDGSPLPRSSFATGELATVSGSFVSGVFVVTAVELLRNAIEPAVRTEGPAYLVSLAQQTLRVNGIAVSWSAATRIDGNLNELRGGVPVRVEGRIAAGVLLATRLTLRP